MLQSQSVNCVKPPEKVAAEQPSSKPPITKTEEKEPSLDYMFVLISNESFTRCYKDTKVFVNSDASAINTRGPNPKYQRANEPFKVIFGSPQPSEVNLNGLVSVNKIDKQYSNEVPMVQCHL